jgi:four helix bundle protein
MEPAHRKLDAWTFSVALAVDVTKLSATFPIEERYGLSAQLRRAAVSIAANVSEGAGYPSPVARRHYVAMARASLNEVDTLLFIAEQLGYVDGRASRAIYLQCEKVGRILGGLFRSLQKRASNPERPTPNAERPP